MIGKRIGFIVAVLGVAVAATVSALAASAGVAAHKQGDPTQGVATQLAAPPTGAAPTVVAPAEKICSFDGTRSRAPFATSTGDIGYAHLRASLLNAANFGPSGKVHRTIRIAAGVPTITSSNLVGCAVFFTSVFTPALSAAEKSALTTRFNQGMDVITDADSIQAEMDAVNSVLAATGTAGTVGPGTTCNNDANGGSLPTNAKINHFTYGPFGDLRGNTWGTSIAAVVSVSPSVVACSGTNIHTSPKQNLMVGGDPSGVDLFTSPSGSLFNPSNEAAYLNFIGGAN